MGDEVKIEASTSWRVDDDIQEVCYSPAKGALTLTLKVAGHQDPANVDIFRRYGSTVAGPKAPLPEIAGVQATLDGTTHAATVTIHWKTPGTDIQVFPGADAAVKIGSIAVQKTENDVTPITIKFELVPGQKPASDRLPSLIAFRTSDGHMRGIESGIPLK